MNRSMNDMDQWLKQSAEMGNAPFNETDWQHMQQLLQPKNKRRFVLFWWLFGLLVGCGIGSYLLMDRNGAKLTKTVIAAKERKGESGNAEKETADKKEAVNTDWKENKTLADTKGKTDELKDSRSPANHTISKQELNSSTREAIVLNKKVVGKQTLGILPTKKGTAFVNGKSQTRSLASNAVSVHTIINHAITPAIQDPVTISNTDSLLLQQHKFLKGQLAQILLNTISIKDRKIDSITDLQLPKDSSAKKKQQQKKNEWLLAAGYYTGKVPLQSKGFNLRFGYGIKLGSFFIQPSIGASNFNPTEQQLHTGISIRQSSGTTLSEVKTIKTYYAPNNGFLVQPSLSLGFSLKKIKLYAGLQQNIALNGNNKTDNILRDSTFYLVLPANIKATEPYNASKFNGNKSLSMNIGFRYNVGKRWFANIEYNRLIDYSTIEGVLDEKKKRSALSLHIGIRF